MSRPAILDALAVATLAEMYCDAAERLADDAHTEADDECARDELRAARDDLGMAWIAVTRAHVALLDLSHRIAPAPRPVTPLDVARRAGWVA